MSNSIFINALGVVINWLKNSELIKWLARCDSFLVKTTRSSLLVRGFIRDDSPFWQGSRLHRMMLGYTRRLQGYDGRIRTGLMTSKTFNLPHAVTYNRLLQLTALGGAACLAAGMVLDLIFPPLNITGLVIKCPGLILLALLSRRDDIMAIYQQSYINKITNWIIDYEH